MSFAKRTFLTLSVALAAVSINVSAADPALAPMPAAKVDSGLGELPVYTEWREPWLYAIPAEKIDSGLGELPVYTEWRQPWLYAIPAEKIDSGLGELTAQRVQAQAPAPR